MGKEDALTKSIGKKIKLARTNAKLTQEGLAEKTGLSSRYISQLERGLAFGSAKTIVGICKTLNIDSNFLFSDLIDAKNTTSINNIVDMKFLQNYIQLNTFNRQFVDLIIEQLLKLQNNKEPKGA